MYAGHRLLEMLEENGDMIREVPPKPRTRPLNASRKRAKKVVRLNNVSKLKKELDAVFSKYIRAKYPKVCYTCKREGKTLQCGHFVTRNHLATRWLESNCRPQCVGCNLYGGGKPFDFEENLVKEIGADAVQGLKDVRHKIMKLDRVWYEQKIEEVKGKLALLVTNKV